ncbi:MAG: Ribosomal small subunit methyltransferase, partial [Burkholderiaceae bacterium]|nr:Ribosomal small subunit methyltransferase [Burkholderiaceae bacterium]
LGTLRRNPDIKWRQTPETVAEMQQKQIAILNSAARLVKAGGRLVYATCSLLHDENEDVAAQFLASHPDFALVPMKGVLAEQKIPLKMNDYLALLPHRHQTDGFFAAVFERKAAAKKKANEKANAVPSGEESA